MLYAQASPPKELPSLKFSSAEGETLTALDHFLHQTPITAIVTVTWHLMADSLTTEQQQYASGPFPQFNHELLWTMGSAVSPVYPVGLWMVTLVLLPTTHLEARCLFCHPSAAICWLYLVSQCVVSAFSETWIPWWWDLSRNRERCGWADFYCFYIFCQDYMFTS